MLKRLARSRPSELPRPQEQQPRAEEEKKFQPDPQLDVRREEESPWRQKRHWLIRDLAGFEFPYEP
jgi:hypothetical protein